MQTKKQIKRILLSGPFMFCLIAAAFISLRSVSDSALSFTSIILTYFAAIVIGTLLELYIYALKKLFKMVTLVNYQNKSYFVKWFICAAGFGLFLGLPLDFIWFLISLFIFRALAFKREIIQYFLLFPLGGFIGGTVFFFALLLKQAKGRKQ